AYHFLLDRAEDRAALAIQHLDAHAVAEAQPGRLRRTVPESLEHAALGEAGRADLGALRARGVVGDGARAHDGAGAEVPGGRRVRDQAGEVEGHVDSGIRLAEPRAVDVADEGQVHLVVAPGVAQLVRRHR